MTESHGTLQKQEAKGAANKVEKLWLISTLEFQERILMEQEREKRNFQLDWEASKNFPISQDWRPKEGVLQWVFEFQGGNFFEIANSFSLFGSFLFYTGINKFLAYEPFEGQKRRALADELKLF